MHPPDKDEAVTLAIISIRADSLSTFIYRRIPLPKYHMVPSRQRCSDLLLDFNGCRNCSVRRCRDQVCLNCKVRSGIQLEVDAKGCILGPARVSPSPDITELRVQPTRPGDDTSAPKWRGGGRRGRGGGGGTGGAGG